MIKLREIRINQHKSQKQVANDLNISEPTFSHYETGRYEPDVATLILLADYFGCSVDFLIGHQTASTVQLDLLTDAQKELFGLLRNLSDRQIDKVIGYINSLTENKGEKK